MAIIVEDGSIVANANSYITEAELTAYATARGVTLTATATVLIIKAMDYIETLDFIGDKQTESQSLQWPREGVYIDDYYIEPTTIPDELKRAQNMLALSIDAGVDPMATIGRATKREKMDVLEVEYMDNAASQSIITSVNRMLKKIVKSGANSTAFNVSRG